MIEEIYTSILNVINRPIEGGFDGDTLPRTNLVGYWKTYDTDHFVDRIGANTRTLYNLQYIASTGTLELTHASIVGTETVTKPTGTATVTVAAGKLTIGSGALWSFSLSNGSTYEYATALTATQGVVWDVSGNGRHLLFTVADTSAVCVSSREKGSDWLNQKGFTVADGSQYLDIVGLSLIPDGKIIPALSSGASACSYSWEWEAMTEDGESILVDGELAYEGV